ncbi:MAG TPA: hypothetical protein VFY64_10995, partial [Nitrososphaeraceae archaeon]|nr:hypothetical protein [Nitrososphaeraceae archaeon]
PNAPIVAIPIASPNPSPLLCATNPTRGKIISLGIGGNIVSSNVAAKMPGYPILDIQDVTVSVIP